MFGLGFLVQIAGGVVTIWYRVKRRPPVEQTFATKEELRLHAEAQEVERIRMERRIQEITEDRKRNVAILHEKIDRLSTSIQMTFMDIARDLGRFETAARIQERFLALKTDDERKAHDARLHPRA